VPRVFSIKRILDFFDSRGVFGFGLSKLIMPYLKDIGFFVSPYFVKEKTNAVKALKCTKLYVMMRKM